MYEQYTRFILNHYGKSSVVVFDGYENYSSDLKYAEHRRRTFHNSSAEIHFDDNMKASPIQQEAFLGNHLNKVRFINGLARKLIQNKIKVKQATGDADLPIVLAAKEELVCNKSVTVVGEDTDLFVLLIHYGEPGMFMLRPGTSVRPRKVSNIHKVQETFSNLADVVLVLHAVTGCDTTSSFFKKGKKSAIHVLNSCITLKNDLKIFYDPNASSESITDAGEKFILKLYGAPKNIKNLNEYRYIYYKKLVGKQQLRDNFELASLPPTKHSADLHSKRVFCQVQQWLGNNLTPTEWGWKYVEGFIIPISMENAPAPDFILKIVACNCKKQCSKMCSCRKANIFCTDMCGHCMGFSCVNSPVASINDDLSEFDNF